MSPPEIIDAHMHLWDLERNYYPWLCDEPAQPHRYGDPTPIRRTFLPPDYLAAAANQTVVATVHVEAEWNPADPIGETRWLYKMIGAHGLPSVIVAQAWLDHEDAEAVLAAQAAFPLVRGIRHKPRTSLTPQTREPGAPGSMGDRQWRAGFALLEKYGLSFDLQTNYWHLPEAAELAADFPGTQIIVRSAGFPTDRRPAGLASWRRSMAAVAAHPNVAVKISGLGLTGGTWSVDANRLIVLQTIEMFGTDRVMFGCNFPPDSLAANFDTIFDGYAEIIA
ncbi:MAG: amidohydrolase family protein, partial [Proteobacteria bacterium]|nr:amidohydrolase family protein [Pseudomonadota bacterium]